jgi:putative ABC transport system permease protein
MNLLTITAKNLWHRKIRTGLTILGVGVSIAAFISLVGLADNLAQTFKTTLKTRGTDLVVLEKGTVDILSSSIDESYLARIKQLPGVMDASAILVNFYAIQLNQYILVYGWHLHSYLFDELEIKGMYPQRQDEAILGSMAATRLKKNVGDAIEIKGARFRVLGIFQSKSLFEEGAIIIPLEQLQQINRTPHKVTMLNIKVKKEDLPGNDVSKAIERVQSQIADLLPDVEVKNVQSFSSAENPLLAISKFSWAISAVAFVIAILGIVNTMTTSVMERTRDIGILLAMGWRNIRIVALVLHESTMLGFLGGMVGLLLGYGMMMLLVTAPNLQGIIRITYDLMFMMKAIAISLLLGFVSGIYPALRAISIEPIEVLRYE